MTAGKYRGSVNESESFVAVTDVSGKRYYFAKQSADDTVALAGAGEETIGVFDDPSLADTTSARAVSVRTKGPFPLVVDGSGTAISRGDRLKSDASGRGVKVAANDEKYGAVAREASSAANDRIEVDVMQGVHGE